MATLQERSRKPVDSWTKREQLCLASAVLKSGDQNWVSVSRILKQLCGNEGRSQDWYSQKNCAVQYGYLLENVEVTKRKKRSSENTSSAIVEPPTELLVKKLTEERTQELKAQIRREQEEYMKLYNEIKTIESAELTDEQLVAMWQNLKKTETQRSVDVKKKHEEREIVKEIIPQKSLSDTTTVDMDVEEICVPTVKAKPTVNVQVVQAPGTSPLLSSLLKSPTATIPPPLPNLGSTARTTAPTITTLLTSGSIPITNQPAITLKSHISPAEAVQLLTRPMTGPPIEGTVASNTATKVLLSPSQSAPTLSMLLEKTKNQNTIIATTPAPTPIPTLTPTPTPTTDLKTTEIKEEKTNSETKNKNQEEPMEVDEPLESTKNDLSSNELDESDPNEEQQLLEVFKNIGNIDELDIDVAAVIDDEEVDFLKGVDDIELENIIDTKQEQNKEKLKTGDEMKTENTEMLGNSESSFKKKLNVETAEKKNIQTLKAESSTSDDSSDNLPLSTVATMEKKQCSEKQLEKRVEKDRVKSEIKLEKDNKEEGGDTGKEIEVREVQNNIKYDSTPKIDEDVKVQIKFPVESENTDIIIVPEDYADSISNKTGGISTTKTQKEDQNDTKDKELANQYDIESKRAENDIGQATSPQHIADKKLQNKDIVSLNTGIDRKALTGTLESKQVEDTVEETTTKEATSGEGKEEKSAINTIIPQEANEPSSVNTKADENEQTPRNTTSQEILSSSTTPARPPALRKLRERDRSESPLVDDDATTTSEHSTTNQRPRRRYSSTANIDSIPNSPVNSLTSSEHEERRETRGASKKSLLNAYNALQPSKHIAIFQRIFADEVRYHDVCYHQIDLPTIKKNIESGGIRTVSELQRDVMLMCTNILMLSKINSENYKFALDLMHEVQTIREFATPQTTDFKETKTHSNSAHTASGTKGRGGSRKSQRNT